MAGADRLASPPERPLMVFDGDCGFCRFWISRWEEDLRGTVDFRPFQEVADLYPEIPRSRFQSAVQLLVPDGRFFSGAEAVVRARAAGGKRASLLAYERVPFFAAAAQRSYRLIAGHRDLAARVTRGLWGRSPRPSTFRRSRWLFLRALGAIFLVAFVSLAVQANGLFGERGIAPAGDYLRAASRQLGTSAWRWIPSLLWFSSGSGAILGACGAGALFAFFLLLDFAPAISAAACWVLYLSLAAVGQDFLSFQWDTLLIETGFLAIFLAPPRGIRRGTGAGSPSPSPAVLFLFRALLFRLVLSSGSVKLESGDASWRSLTALRFHYETQPLPTWIGWYAHQLPPVFQTVSAAGLFAIELAAPFFLFAPRHLRHAAAISIAFLQVLIAATGNYAFFNLLTAVLCLLACDDARLGNSPSENEKSGSGWPKLVLGALTAAILVLGAVRLAEALRPRSAATARLASLVSFSEPFRTVNSYGLFAVMTTSRPEIVIEGSDDGTTWKPYAFRWKPGDLTRAPAFVAPHQPRLDWQMWFAALSDVRTNPWFFSFVHRLLEGSPDVTGLLRDNPFPSSPPRFVRAEIDDYRFTSFAERRKTGAWWKRRRTGEYLPAVSLEDFRPLF